MLRFTPCIRGKGFMRGSRPNSIACHAGDPGWVEALEGRNYFSIVLQQPVNLPSPGGPAGVTAGDFNGDGLSDLAVTNFSNNQVSVFMGKGGGTFAPAVLYDVGQSPAGIAAADFNGDAKYDLVVANNASGTFSVLLGKGDGTFALSQTVQTGPFPEGVAAGDFNGDGLADVAVGRAGSIDIYLRKADGSFAAPLTTEQIGPGTGGAQAGDFNGDGITDLAVLNQGTPLNNGLPPGNGGTQRDSGTVYVLLGNGDGTFQPKQLVDSGLDLPAALAVGDLNDDGKSDLSVGLFGGTTLRVYTGLGGGKFQASASFNVADGPIAGASADFNNDGESDVAIAAFRGNAVSLLLAPGGTGLISRLTTPDQSFNAAAGDGSGTVAAPFALTRSSGQFDNSVLAVGSPAVASGGRGFGAVLYNADGSLRWQAAADFGAGNDAVAAAATLLPDGRALVLGTVTSAAGVRRLALARFDADGSPDATFGANGQLVGPLLSLTTQVKNLAVQADGKIVVVGQSGADLAVWRYLPSLAPDTTFGRNGLAGVRFGTKAAPQTSLGTAVGLQSGGVIVVGGGVFPTAGTENFALSRFTPAGKLDTTFGAAGTVSTRVSGREEVGDLKISSAGVITVVGGGRSNLAFARYSADGVLDTTFGTGGTLVPAVSGVPAADARLNPDSVNAGLLGLMFDGHLLQTQSTELKKAAGLTADVTPPAATPYRVGTPATGTAPFVFRVQYADNKGVTASTISSQNVFVTGPGGYKQSAGLKSLVSSKNGATRIAFYAAAAPKGGWTSAADGSYDIVLRANQVADTSGNYVAGRTVGTFSVKLPAALSPSLPDSPAALPDGVGGVVPAGGFSRIAVAAPLPWDEAADVLGR